MADPAAPAAADAFAPEIERRYIQKLLWRLVPVLAVLYLACLLDRGNVAIAALTMQKGLHLSDRVYGFGAGIFFVGYFLFEIPSNLILERVGARRWIARIMLTWGAISTAMMFVHSPASFYALRFLLGLAEAGFYPGILLYLSYWTPASARAQVMARFLALTALLGLVGGPLGGLLLHLDGRHGLAGWQWLFLIEGLPSIVLSFFVYRCMTDAPTQASWLTAEEKAWLAVRLERDHQTSDRVRHFGWRTLLSDRRLLYLCAIFLCSATGGNAVGYFGPQLIKSRSGGHWSDAMVATSLILPALVGAVAMMAASGHSDRTGLRRLHVVVGYGIAALGFALCLVAPSAPFVLFALALNAFGERIAAASYWAVTTNLMGARAAAGGLALVNSVGNLGGFFGPLLMGQLKEQSGGGYSLGLAMAAGLMLSASTIAFFTSHHSMPHSAVSKPQFAELLDPQEVRDV